MDVKYWKRETKIEIKTWIDLLLDDELIDKIQSELIPLCSAIVVRKRDSERFNAKRIIVADDNHGRCNELCSTIAELLCQEMSLEDAERRARHILPPEANGELNGRSFSLYQNFMQMLEQDCLNSHDVNYYADKLNVSTRYLSQITRKVAGKSPKSIIDITLLNGIKEQLGSDMTIQEIAYKFAFSSQAHLTNFLKRFTGITPTEYRKFTHP